MGTRHTFVSAKSDGGDSSVVRPSDWNADHTVDALASAAYTRSSGNYSTQSTSFVAIDSTNLSFTITTGAHRVLVGFTGTAGVNNAGGATAWDVEVDGVRQGDTAWGLMYNDQAVANEYVNVSFTYLSDVLTAGSHTFTLMWRNGNGAHTATILSSSGSGVVCRGYVMEQGG